MNLKLLMLDIVDTFTFFSLIVLVVLFCISCAPHTETQTPEDIGEMSSLCSGNTVFIVGLTTVEYNTVFNVKCLDSGGPAEKPWDRQR